MDNVLQDIIKSEEEALKIEEEAKQEALEILSEARKKAEEILEKSLEEGENVAEDLLQKARSEAVKEKNLRESSKDKADEQTRTKSREKLDKAADFIAGRVVNKSWQW
jgi:vacuolar-type H+-ATPase subunit H